MKTDSQHYSLSGRLALAFLAVAAMVFALMGAFLYTSLSSELQRRDDIEIDGKLSQFRQLIHSAGSVTNVRGDSAVFHEILLSHPGVYLSMVDSGGAILVQHPETSGAALLSAYEPLRLHRLPYRCSPKSIGSARCIFSNETLRSGESVRIFLARSAFDRESLLASYRLDVWAAAAIGAALVGLLGYLVARRGLTPVKSIGRQASRIEANNLSERLNIERGPAELNDIAVSINRMLDRLERAFVRLSQFSSDLAHDMRTPLATVISSSQITLSKTRTVEEYEALLESNIEECERLQRMIENMLFLARTDNAKHAIATVDVDVATELRRLASYFDVLADERGNFLRVHGDGTVRADTTMFRRAVSNLVSNALDYASPGSTIELRGFAGRGYTAVSVTNEGVEIPVSDIGRIFDRFYRLDPARHDSGRNAGLGLAIVKSIMELHRGKVEVQSAAGRTTFTLFFPSRDSVAVSEALTV